MDSGLIERVVHINRVAKVVKGGRNFSFNAIVVVGDGNGKVGFGLGKAREVMEAITKGTDIAKRSMKPFPMLGQTLPHAMIGRFGAARVVIKPASPGTGVIAGGAVRAVMESLGVRDVLTKCLGSRNPHNLVKATFNGLENMENLEHVARKRGKRFQEVFDS
ncbi:30S ribosomal protein S5 [bacterium]|nr:30S ribosomal protein S5 [bacterium]